MTTNEYEKPLPFLRIDTGCIACEWCRFNCPAEGCFTFENLTATFHAEGCIECARCIYVCPVDVILPLRPAHPRPAPREQSASELK